VNPCISLQPPLTEASGSRGICDALPGKALEISIVYKRRHRDPLMAFRANLMHLNRFLFRVNTMNRIYSAVSIQRK
jgi:hypothetical protein